MMYIAPSLEPVDTTAQELKSSILLEPMYFNLYVHS